MLSERSESPSTRAKRSTISTMSARTRGSPPVRRTREIPAAAKTRTSRSISEAVRVSDAGARPAGPSGRQYAQRRLQRSVTESRR